MLLAGEVVVYAVLPRAATAREHFELFGRDPLAGLLTLDLLGMVAYLLLIPTMLALYASLRRGSRALTTVATALFFVGIIDFFATNTAFPVLALSQRYAETTSAVERAALLAAGEALFALFNENAFLVSYAIVSLSWALVSVAMLRSSAFGRAAAFTGVLAGATGIAAVILEHVSPSLVPPAIALYFAAIVFLIGWTVLVGRRLVRLGSTGPVGS